MCWVICSRRNRLPHTRPLSVFRGMAAASTTLSVSMSTGAIAPRDQDMNTISQFKPWSMAGCRCDRADGVRSASRRGSRKAKGRDIVTRASPWAGSALLLGETMIGWRVFDVMRAIDWIETRPELDAKRIGCVGISGGGTCTLFSAALEPRIRAALVSGISIRFGPAS